MASVKLKNVVKEYGGGIRAVDDLNLDIYDREFVVLVGPSGCGKSTTLRMIAGLEEMTDGDMYIGDRLVNRVSPKDRNIAMVFQNYALYPNMTVRENMEFGLKMRRTNKDSIKQKVDTAASVLGIEELLDRKPGQLSGGQKQRVALGRAMVRNPDVFLLDEPLSNLDARLRAQMRTEIVRMHRDLDTTFVYVTHDQTEAMTMSDRMVVMKDGRIQQADRPAKIYDEPANMFVAGFVGTPQMNFLPAEVTWHEDGTCRAMLGEYAPEVAAIRQLAEGQRVMLGVRAEDISLSDEEGIPAVLNIRELMGAEEYMYFTTESGTITARVPGRASLREGSRVRLRFDESRLHLFDIETENRIM